MVDKLKVEHTINMEPGRRSPLSSSLFWGRGRQLPPRRRPSASCREARPGVGGKRAAAPPALSGAEAPDAHPPASCRQQ